MRDTHSFCNFRQTFDVGAADFNIDYTDRILTVGSCFAENVAGKLTDSRMNVTVNPFGILYNPLSILRSLQMISSRCVFTSADVFMSGGMYHSFMHHSRFSRPTSDECVSAINISVASVDLRKISVAIITLGTALVYELKETGEVVANCHKQSADMFLRHRLSVSECADALSQTVEILRQSNPEVRVILTVSPVRHLKDRCHENTLSKSTLHLAVEEAVSRYECCDYFPAYELLIDDLRDYRFYAEDLSHPSSEAVEYVFSCFCERYLTDET